MTAFRASVRASSRVLPLGVALVVATLLGPAVPVHAAARTAPQRARAAVAPRVKSPQVRPSRPAPAQPGVSKIDEDARSVPTPRARAIASAAAATESAAVPGLAASAVDTTPPSAPTGLVAAAPSIATITAQWNPAQDAESGIASYVFAVGTTNVGTPTEIANVRWWQVTYATNISVNLNLDPARTYYVSVQARNGAGLTSPIVTSAGVQPVWTPLGQAGNVMQLRLATTGLDTSGNATAGWSAAQVATMSAFFDRMYPVLVKNYRPPAESYTVTVVRDLRYTGSNIFFPSLDEIHMADSFSPQLFTHELVHAFRNDRLLSSDQNWNFNSTLSPFEEAFAQAVSYESMNDYVATYPSDPVVPATSLWGSSADWDYDFQNVAELRGTDLWSDGGGTGLYWLRYEMGAAALRKIELESPDFYRRFNAEYYARINAAPTVVRPTRALIVDIIRTLVPTIEGRPASDWVDAQHALYAQNVYGKKIFHRIQDYPWNELFAFQDVYFMETMACGSEWACFDGAQWVYHRLNGAQGSGRLLASDGSTVWSGPLSIQPAQNPADGYNAFGFARKSLTTATTVEPWPGGDPAGYVMNLRTLGLYEFQSTFLDPATQVPTSNHVYRVMGSEIAGNFRGVWGGVLGHRTGTLSLDHEGYPAEPAIPVVNGAFAATRGWAGVANARTGGRDSVPGRVFATFVDGQTGVTYHAQRNVDYGSVNGNQMFLFDFTGPGTPPADTAAPTVTLTAPASGASVSGSVTLSGTATDAGSGVARVEFLVDGAVVGTDTSSPYQVAWNAEAASLGTHTVVARAFDTAGNQAATGGRSVTVVDRSAPALTITSPANGSTVTRNSTVTIRATSTDNRGVARVRFWVNNQLRCTDTTSAYTCNWSVPSGRGVRYTIRVRADDGSSNSTEKTVTVTSSR
jgi:hypothetical protein